MTLSLARLAVCALLSTTALVGCNEQPLGPEEAAVPTTSAAVALPSDATTDAAAEVRLRANFTATAADRRADGKADFRSRTNGRRQFSAEVEDVSTDGQGRVLVTRAGTTILDRAITIAGGFGDLNLDTGNGQTVPKFKARDLVQVFNPAGTLILQGTFAAN